MKTNKLISLALGGMLSLGTALGYNPSTETSYMERPAPIEQVIDTETPAAQSLETTVDNELPHFLRDINVPKDEYGKILSYDRLMHTSKGIYGSWDSQTLINEAGNFTAEIYGQEVKFFLTEYTIEENNGKKYLWYHTNLGKEKLDLKEFDLIKKYLIKQLKTAVERAYEPHKNLKKDIISIQEKELKKHGILDENQSLGDILDQKVNGYNHLTIADVQEIPNIQGPEDYVPSELYFGPFYALGACYIDTDIVLYHPIAAKLDHINQVPTILVHEAVHNCEHLQILPNTSMYDVELFTSLATIGDEDMAHFLWHSYLYDVRDMIEVLTGLEYKRARREYMGFTLLSLQKYDKEKTLKYIKEVKKVSSKMQEIVNNEFFAEYYAHRLYYNVIEEDLQDDAAGLRLFLYSRYAPRLLNGERLTKQFLDENELVFDEIFREAEAAIKEEKEKKEREKDTEFNEQEREVLRDIALKLGFKNDHELGEIFDFAKELERYKIIKLRRRGFK